MLNESRRRTLFAALAFLQLKSAGLELQLVQRWLDTWAGLGLVVGGVWHRKHRPVRVLAWWILQAVLLAA